MCLVTVHNKSDLNLHVMFRRTVMAAVYFMSCKCKVVILAVFDCDLSISSFH